MPFKKPRHFFSLLAIFLSTHTLASQKDSFVWFHWYKVKSALYYRGVYKSPGKNPVVFRTTDNKYLVPKDARVRVIGYDSEGHIKTMQFTPGKITASDFLKMENRGKKPAVKKPPLDPKEEEGWLYESDEIEGETDFYEEAKSPEKKERGVISRDPGRDTLGAILSLRFGLGKEALESQGGITDWQTDAYVGGFGVRLTDREMWFPPLKENPLTFVLDLSGHNLEVSTFEENKADSSTNTIKQSYFRTRMALNIYLNLTPFTDKILDDIGRLYVGGGFETNRLPVLGVDSGKGGIASAKDTFLMGPSAGLIYILPFSHTFYLTANSQLMPYGIDITGKDNTTGYSIFNEAKLMLEMATSYWVDVGININLIEARKKADCQGENLCENQAKTTSKLTRVWLGFHRDL